MTSVSELRARYIGRPLLMTPDAATELLHRLASADPRGMRTEGRFLANLRKIFAGNKAPMAMEDEEAQSPAEPEAPLCYSPLWAQQAYGEPEDEGFGWSLYNGVALFEICTAISDRGTSFCGTWYHGYDTLLAGYREAAEDPRVKAIFTRVRSPGGVATSGILELAAYIRSIRAAAGGKPIHFYCDAACSAAYWIVSQGDRVSGGKFSMIGSIGAVYTHEDLSGAYAQAGIAVTSIEFPINGEKTAFAEWKGLSPLALADMQSEITEIGVNFLSDVHEGRPHLTADSLEGLKARVFMGSNADESRSALALGLIDAVETEQQAFTQLLSVIGEASDAPLPESTTAPNNPTATVQSKETGMFTKKPKAQANRQGQKPAKPSASAEAPAPEDDEDDESNSPADGDSDETDDQTSEVADEAPADDATAIAASAEAKAHPHLALAAIQSGQNMKQFKASVSGHQAALAAAPQGKRQASSLNMQMANQQRVGTDKSVTKTNPLVANAKSRRTGQSA